MSSPPSGVPAHSITSTARAPRESMTSTVASLASGVEQLIGCFSATEWRMLVCGYECRMQQESGRGREEPAPLSAPPSAARRTLGVTDGPAVYAGHGPAALLRPERKVVAFTGRAGELDELQQWCASDLARSVRALTGAGGVG